MDAQMESVELKANEEHQNGSPPDQPFLEASHAPNGIYDDPPVCPRIGKDYQVEIPSLATESERRQLMASPSDSCRFLDYDYPVGIGLAIPIMWAGHPLSEIKGKKELQAHHASETEAKDSGRDEESQVTPIDQTCNKTSECDSSYKDTHSAAPANQVESSSSHADDRKSAPCLSGEHPNFKDKPEMQPTEAESFVPLPGSSTSIWSDAEAECFLLGLYIFGKDLGLGCKFVESKTIGDVLSYYYGRFYKTDAYQRWSDCRKIKARRCIVGQRIFTGWRQQELISRLQSTIPKEAHDSLLEVFKSLNEGQASFEKFVFTLKSTVGMEAFVAAIGIGKGKHDLTGIVLDPTRTNQVVSTRPEIPAGKACSSLASEEIIKFLTGDFRLSKTRSNDIFWEAVWPRLLARGWHSEQPKDVSTAKNALVYLMPGIKKFSRKKLTKGTHYFDSVSDVLNKVAADPILLKLDINGMDNGVTVDKNVWATDTKPTENDLQDHQTKSYLKPRVPNHDQELVKFTVIDTSLVEGEEPFKVRELRSLPADANVSFGGPHHSGNSRSSSSSEEQDLDDSLSDDQEASDQATADDKDVEMVPVHEASKVIQMDAVPNLGTKSSSVVPVNGHASDEQHVDISNDKGDEKDLTSFFGLGAKAGRHEYLSPVTKRRRLASCNNDRTGRRSFSFSKGEGLNKGETKSLSSSSKPTGIDAGITVQTKTLPNCSTKDGQHEEKRNATSSATNESPQEENRITADSNKDMALEEKVTAVDGVPCSKEAAHETQTAKEGAQLGNLIDLNKPDTPVDNDATTNLSISSTGNHGSMLTDEAPSVSDSKAVPEAQTDEAPSMSVSKMASDVPEATGNHVGAQPDQPSQMNPRRQGTRNRPPTARALEAVAFGLLGGTKRKGDLKDSTTSRPRRRAR